MNTERGPDDREDAEPIFHDDAYFVDNLSDVASASFTSEMAANAKGNFIFSFGDAGSGKSSFHFHLIRYIEQGNDFDSIEVVPRRHGVPNFQAAAIMDDWRQRWSEGRFPESTDVNTIKCLSYTATPRYGRKTPMEFSVIEVSGEKLRTVIQTDDKAPHIPEELDALFANPNVNITLVMLLHPKRKNNDVLFSSFLRYLRGRHPQRTQDTPLLLVVPDPVSAKATLSTVNPAFSRKDFDAEMTLDFVQTLARSTYQELLTWPTDEKYKSLARFRIGDIKRQQVRTGDEENVIVQVDFFDVAKIFRFCYEYFAGERIGYTLWQKFKRSLKGH